MGLEDFLGFLNHILRSIPLANKLEAWRMSFDTASLIDSAIILVAEVIQA